MKKKNINLRNEVLKQTGLLFLWVIFLVLILFFNVHILVFIFLVPFLFAIYGSSWRKSLIIGFLYGFIFNVIFGRWVYWSNCLGEPILGLILILVNTLGFVIIALLINYLFKKNEKNFVRIFVPSFVFTIMIFIFIKIGLNTYLFNFTLLHPLTSPLISYLGSWGINFILILFNTLLFLFLKKKQKKYLIFLAVLLLVFVSCFIYSNVKEFKLEDSIKIALIQGNFSKPFEWREENAGGIILKTYENLSLESLKFEPDIIVWPEYSIPIDIFKDHPELYSNLTHFINKTNTTFIIGSYIGESNFIFYNYYNVMLIFSSDGKVIANYSSINPLDTINYYEYDKITLNENKIKPFTLNEKLIGLSICNDETDYKIYNNYALDGAELFISGSNNQGSCEMREIISHFSMLRAAENEKYFARVTNDGITKVLSPTGKILARLNKSQSNFLIFNIYPNHNITFFAKNDYVILSFIMSTIFLIILSNFLFQICRKTR